MNDAYIENSTHNFNLENLTKLNQEAENAISEIYKKGKLYYAK